MLVGFNFDEEVIGRKSYHFLFFIYITYRRVGVYSLDFYLDLFNTTKIRLFVNIPNF